MKGGSVPAAAVMPGIKVPLPKISEVKIMGAGDLMTCPDCGDFHCSEVIRDAELWRKERDRRREYMRKRRG